LNGSRGWSVDVESPAMNKVGIVSIFSISSRATAGDRGAADIDDEASGRKFARRHAFALQHQAAQFGFDSRDGVGL